MKIIESFITNNRRYKANVKFAAGKPIGLMLHSVGCAQSDASVFIKNNDTAASDVAVHAYIQPDGVIYQCLPWDRAGWHGGHKFSNNNYIGVEMTEPRSIRYVNPPSAEWVFVDEKAARLHIEATYHYAVELFAYLCKMFDLDPLKDGVIISHSEGNKRGIATAHADVEHIWNKVGLTMDQFRKDVDAAMHPAEPEPTPKDYSNQIKILYAEFLGRAADADGLKHWNEIWNKNGFQKVYNGISGSKEGKKHYVRGMYRDFLGREANTSEVNAWYEKSRIDIYNGITGSAEYKKKH